MALYGSPAPLGTCAHTDLELVNTDTGEVASLDCRANSCLAHARLKVDLLGKAIALAQPDWMFRYSLVPASWCHARKKINRAHEYLRRKGRKVRVCYAIERNPRATGCHAHGYAYGDPIDDLLGVTLEHAGLGFDHHIQPVTHATWLAYPLKQAQHNRDSLDDFLGMNGGRLLHPSPGFFRRGRRGPSMTQKAALGLVRPQGRKGRAFVRIRQEGPASRHENIPPGQQGGAA